MVSCPLCKNEKLELLSETQTLEKDGTSRYICDICDIVIALYTPDEYEADLEFCCSNIDLAESYKELIATTIPRNTANA